MFNFVSNIWFGQQKYFEVKYLSNLCFIQVQLIPQLHTLILSPTYGLDNKNILKLNTQVTYSSSVIPQLHTLISHSFIR